MTSAHGGIYGRSKTGTTHLVVSGLLPAVAAYGADSIKGQVQGGGDTIAKSTVTLWDASDGAPKQLDQTKTNDDGRFEVRAKDATATPSFIWRPTVECLKPAKRAVTIPPSRCWRL